MNITVSDIRVSDVVKLEDNSSMITLSCKVEIDGQTLFEIDPEDGISETVTTSYIKQENGELDLEDYDYMNVYRLGSEEWEEKPAEVHEAILAAHFQDK